MRSRNVYILLWFIALGNSMYAQQQQNDSVFQSAVMQSFKLVDVSTAKNMALKNPASSEQLLLFIFFSPDCPLCKNYTPVLNTLQQQYGQVIKMIGIIPGKAYTAATINAFGQKYKIGYPLLIDPLKKLSTYLHAVITPEVVLLNSQLQLVYRGAIDNRVKQLGVKRWQASEYYLSDAISQYLQHTNVAVKRVKAVGCLINDF
ncbi:MAG: redoxin domain-containing protein [Chitinophagaceae bacterium]